MGRNRRDAVRSQLRRIIEHGLKLDYSLAHEPRRGWLIGIGAARRLPASLFYRLFNVGLLLAGSKLLWDGLR